MNRQLDIISDGNVIFSGFSHDIVISISGDNEFMYKDVKGAMEWLEANCLSDGKIVVDIVELIDTAAPLDGMKTRALFWLAALMMKNGTLRQLPPAAALKLIPFIQAKTKLHEIKQKNQQ